METSMNSKVDGDDITGTEILNMAPLPTATQESEQATEINDAQLPALSNDPGQQFTGKAPRAEIPDSEDFSESSGDDVYVPACGLPQQEGIRQGGKEESTGSNGIESLDATTSSELDGIASSNPVEGDMQVEDTTPLPNTNIRAPMEWNPVKFMGTRMPVSIIGAPITGPADAPQASHVASTTTGTPQIPPSSPIASSQPDGEKTADEVASGNDGNPEENKDAEMAEVPASDPELETPLTSSEEKPRSNIPGHEDIIEGTTHSSTVLQHLDAFEKPSVNLTHIPAMSEPAIEAPSSPLLASLKGNPANSVGIQASSPRSIQDSADSSRVSSPKKSAARKTLPSTIEDAPEVEKVRADISSSPPKPDGSQSKSSKRSTPTASFSVPEGSQSKDILVAELKAMKIASIQARNIALEAEIAARRAKLSDVTKDLKKPAEETVKRHIKLLHDYNDIRDVGQGLVGMIADNRGVRIGELYEEFGVGLKD